MKRPRQWPFKISAHKPVKDTLSRNQLSNIGAITIAYNDIESVIDLLLAITMNVPPALSLEIGTRINGIEGKIEIFKAGLKHLDADPGLVAEVSGSLGQSGFLQLKKYRDAVIHARIIDPSVGIGLVIDRRGRSSDVLLSETALERLYEVLTAHYPEIFSIAEIARQLTIRELAKEHGIDLTGPDGSEIGRELQKLTTQYRRHRDLRLSLPPLPEFPDPPATNPA